MKSVAELIADMQDRGWTVTFPAFGQTRSMVVRASKGDQEFQRGWLPSNDDSLTDAVRSLHEQTAIGK